VRVGDEDLVRQGADKAIAPYGDRCRHPGILGNGRKGRKYQQPSFFEGWLEFGLSTHADNAPSRHLDDGLTAPEKNPRHSHSIAEWKPPMRIRPSSRSCVMAVVRPFALDSVSLDSVLYGAGAYQ
jgi:hypothetical protein